MTRCLPMSIAIKLVIVSLFLAQAHPLGADERVAETYRDLVEQDGPVAYWSFDDEKSSTQLVGRKSTSDPERVSVPGKVEGSVQQKQIGPRSSAFPLFGIRNQAVSFVGKKGVIRYPDFGESSIFDFKSGDAITLEAWVALDALGDGQRVYVIGKGSTNNKGTIENQSWGLQLSGVANSACLGFVYRARDYRAGDLGDSQSGLHRWTSDFGIAPDGDWHHVAVSYQFGLAESIRAYIDGRPVAGRWDQNGPASWEPVRDDDEICIGSGPGGNPVQTLSGSIDEVALYRTALSAERIAARYSKVPHSQLAESRLARSVPPERAVVEIYEGLPKRDTWTIELDEPTLRFDQSTMSLVTLPRKYGHGGVLVDRTNPLLARIWFKHAVSENEAGPTELLLRTKGPGRLFVDGKLVGQTNFISRNSSGHEAVPELAAPAYRDLCPLAAGHQEQFCKMNLEPGERIFRLDVIVGGSDLRPEIGEVCVAIRRSDDRFQILSGDSEKVVHVTEAEWVDHAAELERHVFELDTIARHQAAQADDHYWAERHAYARSVIRQNRSDGKPAAAQGTKNDRVDYFVNAKLAADQIVATDLTTDFEFLRRASIDLIGVAPSREELKSFLALPEDQRRSAAIDRLLADPRWADNWVGYWQDVLAENPGILKPELNNTGPFRIWIYESFYDGKSFDRLVTELVQMEGSRYYGGPAGFGIATQNDVPFAEKANVLAQAFLGMDMKCARCHDAPYQPLKQSELFHVAAMLNRKPITVPGTSSVPQTPGARKALVTVTLKPGSAVEPSWPFAHLSSEPLPEHLQRSPDDSRERLAALITSPHNGRFAQVVANRLWKRYFGRGIVEPVDDWHAAEPSHPELLRYLADEFVESGYDLKHITRLMLNSHAYQRKSSTAGNQSDSTNVSTRERLFGGAIPRRLTAEQVVDSLFSIAGKGLESEPLTMDPEGRRPVETFLHLGNPSKAWQFTSLSNERDRPALALPRAQSIIDLLVTFGWRDARPNPLTEREREANVLQPLALANGVAASRIVRLSDDSRLTSLCLQDVPLEVFVHELFMQVLSRPASDQELQQFASVLGDGFEFRRIDSANQPAAKPRRRRDPVSWSNHLSAEATIIKNEQEREVRAGDPPTLRLNPNWRERAEDCVWALINSPEFLFLP